jgi:hypothetical protein
MARREVAKRAGGMFFIPGLLRRSPPVPVKKWGSNFQAPLFKGGWGDLHPLKNGAGSNFQAPLFKGGGGGIKGGGHFKAPLFKGGWGDLQTVLHARANCYMFAYLPPI